MSLSQYEAEMLNGEGRLLLTALVQMLIGTEL